MQFFYLREFEIERGKIKIQKGAPKRFGEKLNGMRAME
jgi:hypothetical protein